MKHLKTSGEQRPRTEVRGEPAKSGNGPSERQRRAGARFCDDGPPGSVVNAKTVTGRKTTGARRSVLTIGSLTTCTGRWPVDPGWRICAPQRLSSRNPNALRHPTWGWGSASAVDRSIPKRAQPQSVTARRKASL